jgi:AcrR family transcriptional regulator
VEGTPVTDRPVDGNGLVGFRTRAPRGMGARLRGELLVAARELLTQTRDIDAVTIRSVATRTGVSVGSVYRHFRDKVEMVDAVAAEAFSDLDAAMTSAADSTDEPLEALLACGEAYVRFARDNPAAYAFLMRSETESSTGERVLQTAAFRNLVHRVRRCEEAGVHEPGSAEVNAWTLWAVAHGLASMSLAKPHWPLPPTDEFVRNALAATGVGLSARWRSRAFPSPPDQSPRRTVRPGSSREEAR